MAQEAEGREVRDQLRPGETAHKGSRFTPREGPKLFTVIVALLHGPLLQDGQGGQQPALRSGEGSRKMLILYFRAAREPLQSTAIDATFIGDAGRG